MKTLLQSAHDEWPEDEAYGLARAHLEQLREIQGDAEEIAYENAAFPRSCDRMRGILRREEDGDRLVARFDAALVKFLAE